MLLLLRWHPLDLPQPPLLLHYRICRNIGNQCIAASPLPSELGAAAVHDGGHCGGNRSQAATAPHHLALSSPLLQRPPPPAGQAGLPSAPEWGPPWGGRGKQGGHQLLFLRNGASTRLARSCAVPLDLLHDAAGSCHNIWPLPWEWDVQVLHHCGDYLFFAAKGVVH